MGSRKKAWKERPRFFHPFYWLGEAILDLLQGRVPEDLEDGVGKFLLEWLVPRRPWNPWILAAAILMLAVVLDLVAAPIRRPLPPPPWPEFVPAKLPNQAKPGSPDFSSLINRTGIQVETTVKRGSLLTRQQKQDLLKAHPLFKAVAAGHCPPQKLAFDTRYIVMMGVDHRLQEGQVEGALALVSRLYQWPWDSLRPSERAQCLEAFFRHLPELKWELPVLRPLLEMEPRAEWNAVTQEWSRAQPPTRHFLDGPAVRLYWEQWRRLTRCTGPDGESYEEVSRFVRTTFGDCWKETAPEPVLNEGVRFPNYRVFRFVIYLRNRTGFLANDRWLTTDRVNLVQEHRVLQFFLEVTLQRLRTGRYPEVYETREGVYPDLPIKCSSSKDGARATVTLALPEREGRTQVFTYVLGEPPPRVPGWRD